MRGAILAHPWRTALIVLALFIVLVLFWTGAFGTSSSDDDGESVAALI